MQRVMVFFVSLSFILVFYLNAAEVCDSVMVDKLVRYVQVPESTLNVLYDRATVVKYDETEFLSRLSFDRPIFRYFPDLERSLPHIDLGDLPTPIEKLQKLGETIGCANLYIKRDDNTGKKVSGKVYRLFGGNKIRKLEFLLAEALSLGCKTVMTIGGAGSNHALATTVCSSNLGLDSVSILGPQENNSIVKRNLLLGKFYGANLNYFKNWKDCPSGIAKLFFSIKEIDEIFPYYITVGGSCPLGAIGFVNAAFELKKQIQQGLIPEPDFVYVACGSMGTAAGLILGFKAAGLQSKVIAVKVGNSPRKSKIVNLVKETNFFLHQKDSNFPIFDIREDDIFFEEGFLGEGYACSTEEAIKAIELMNDCENINLDLTYSGKAFAAIVDHARENLLQDKVVLFWDTFCGYDYVEIISTVNYKALPRNLHIYFD